MGAVRAFVPGGGRIAELIESTLVTFGPGGITAEAEPRINFRPAHQVLHRPHPLTVVIEDPSGISNDFDLQVSYNGFDVTGSFLEQATLRRDARSRKLAISVPSVTLRPSEDHSIEFYYRNSHGARVRATLGAPVCRPFLSQRVESLDRFRTSPRVLALIERLSREAGFNPAFTAGLIAKESSFDLEAVSWARAIGLTQVTPIAETEISGSLAGYPRYEGLAELPLPVIKALIWSGRVNSENEWRLNPEKSVRGGLAFLLYLYDRWSTVENNARIAALASSESGTPGASDADELRMRLVLASYNSGYARVSGAFRRQPASWQNEPELKGIRKYVDQVVSYCDRFTQSVPIENEEAAPHENET
jgi:hypothetical protein